MGKISPIAAKYIINAEIEVNGIVEKPDAVGAIFGQTEGLLGPDLELRELQRSGRIGRIEVQLKSRSGKAQGSITVPSSLDKSETAIIGAALETVDRIGPCSSKIRIQKIEDVRAAKRKYIVDRAKELLKQMLNEIMPDSQEISDNVKKAVRVQELIDFGADKLPSGPNVAAADDIVVVEGRADVVTLLKHGIKNCIAVEGTNVPTSLVELTKQKNVTVFVDGDHGGELIIKELVLAGAELDSITHAPSGREVEELTKKEIHKALRAAVPIEQYSVELGFLSDEGEASDTKSTSKRSMNVKRPTQKTPPKPINKTTPPVTKTESPAKPAEVPNSEVIAEEMVKKADPARIKKYKEMMESLVGTRGAYLLDKDMQILGRIPIIELRKTLNDVDKVFAVVFDGVITKKLVDMAESKNIEYLIGMKVVGLHKIPDKTILLTPAELGDL